MTKVFSILIFLLFSTGIFSQTITLTNGKKEIQISPEAHLKASLGINLSDCSNSCDGIYLIGNLSKAEKDSLTMQLSEYRSFASIEGVKLLSNIYSRNAPNNYKFAIADISTLEVFKSKKAEKRKKKASIIGGILVVTGLTTGLNS